ncbi:hypothetical protein GH714_013192 [Hevea brasiliensis]|uniref:Uncharacterized protein n=1 Tax=Hevea brasiliensis TaxID=3981 RepID=A0A6A6LRI9_HEVBR|nr:hypothetical protein GH714_013192 [Hevea brasiliensis]
MCQLDEYLQHLRRVSEDYQAKTGKCVFLGYGWKSSAVFKLVNSIRTNGVPSLSLVELTQEQMRKVEALRVKIRLEEEKVEREMERQQVAIADRKMAELVRLVVRVKNGEQVRQWRDWCKWH